MKTPLPPWFLTLLAACGGADPDPGKGRSDEADTDTDTDTDADADADADADTDADTDTEPTTPTEPFVDPVVSRTENPDGTVTLVVDARDPLAWHALSLADAAAVEVEDLATADTWDLALRQYAFVQNSGPSGPADVAAAALREVAFDELTAPVAGFAQDRPDETGDGNVEGVLDAWYDYDYVTHYVSLADVAFAIRDRSGAVWRFRMDAYYDAAEAAHYPAFTFGPAPAPAKLSGADLGGGVAELVVDATSEEEWTYVSLFGSAEVVPVDPATSASWDLRLRRTALETNGGTQGPAGVGAMRVPDAFADLAAPPDPLTLVSDEDADGDGELEVAAFDAWYDYDFRSHTVTPKAETWVVGRGGRFVKLAIVAYADAAGTTGVYTLHVAPLEAP